MGKYAYVKLSIILYHGQTDLSIGFLNFIENCCCFIIELSEVDLIVLFFCKKIDKGDSVMNKSNWNRARYPG
jgi:hypothetical protein